MSISEMPKDSNHQVSIYRFERNDRSLGGVTTAEIDASNLSATPINPRIFGNFIEHLGHVVYGGLTSQALHNPNLENEFETNTVPPYWDFTGAATWERTGAYSPRCVRLSPGSAFNAGGALFQEIDLPLKRVRNYHLTLFARSIGSAGAVQISIDRLRNTELSSLWKQKSEVNSASWIRLSLSIALPENIDMKGVTTRLTLLHVKGDPVEVDQIELEPDDSIQGVDPDVLKKAKEWNISVLRWPGGNFVSGYNWRDGVGAREKRPTYKNPAWDGIEQNTFGSIEFIRYCKLLGVTPQLCINAGNGTPEAAADWIRFFNDADSKSEMGRLRADNGEKNPFRIRLCEVGNELYGDWQIGHTNAPENAARYVRFREALLKAAPTLSLMATGKGDEYSPEGWKRCLDWNEALMKAAVEKGGLAPDYLTIHPLIPLPGIVGNASYEELYENAMAFPTFFDRVMEPDLKALIERTAGKGAKTKIAPTEWGIIVGGDKWREGPNHDTLAGAIFNALQLNAFLRHSDTLTLANMTAFMHGGGIKKSRGVVYADPQYYTQKLFASSHPYMPLPVHQQGPGSDIPARGGMPGVRNVPNIDLFSALSKDGKTLLVYSVNSSLKESRKLTLSLKGFAPFQASAEILTGSDSTAFNSPESPESVSPKPLPLTLDSHAQFATTLPAHSLVVFKFQKK